MWLLEILNIPDIVFNLSRVPLELAQRRSLCLHSTSLFALGKGKELKLILGILPPTVLSDTAYLWLLYVRDAKFTRGELRMIYKGFPLLLRVLGRRKYFATVFDEGSERFIKYLNGSIETAGLYSWEVF